MKFYNQIIFFLFFIACNSSISAQDISSALREKFILDQTEYYKKLNLADKQKRAYEEITRRYDKLVMAANSRGVNTKPILKKKNKEMKALLTKMQYKIYLIRQTEIAKNYDE